MCFLIFTALVFFIETKLCALIFHRNEPTLMKKSDDEDDIQCCSSSEIRESLQKISIVDDTVEGRFRVQKWIFLLILYYNNQGSRLKGPNFSEFQSMFSLLRAVL